MRVYYIYTDGSCNKDTKKISSSYFIRTASRYIALGANLFDDCDIGKGETIAVGVAIETLMKTVDLEKEDRVEIITDCKGTKAYLLENVLSDNKKEFFKDERIKLACNALAKLESMCNVKIKWTKAHKAGEINGNSLADRMAKHSLKSSRVVNI